MSTLRQYGIYTAQFPFLDRQSSKIRPVIIITQAYGKYKTIVVVPVSSKPGLETVDVALSSWESEGLAKASVARVHRLTTVLQSNLISELGLLTDVDRLKVQDALRVFLGL